MVVGALPGEPDLFELLKTLTDAHTNERLRRGGPHHISSFTNPEMIGSFVFHCHVVKHEDKRDS
jgi:hypothetical protein